jgi:lysozyme family protein
MAWRVFQSLCMRLWDAAVAIDAAKARERRCHRCLFDTGEAMIARTDRTPDTTPPAPDDPHADPQAPDAAQWPPFGDPGVESVGPWRAAKALLALKSQIDAACPGRATGYDGTIGDLRHQGSVSDHNPHVRDDGIGVVTAIDITHDPAHGCDAGRLAAALHDARDPRIKYIIWNRRIANASPIGAAPAWAWRTYTGASPHDHHCHISVKADKNFYDDTSPWPIPSSTGGIESSPVPDHPGTGEPEFADIEMALAALGGTQGRPLFESLVDAQDAIAALLSRYAGVASAGKETGGVEAARPGLAQLRDAYLNLFGECQIRPARLGEVAWHRNKLLKNRPRYDEVAAQTGAPWWFVGIVHALEASFSFSGHLHNGDPLTARTVHVPRNQPAQWLPPSDWVSSAVDAIRWQGYAGAADWSLAAALYRFESYNGFGYFARGIPSPYLWSFSNRYVRGKFVSDGKFNPDAVSNQCGAAVMLKALVAAGDVVVAM